METILRPYGRFHEIPCKIACRSPFKKERRVLSREKRTLEGVSHAKAERFFPD
jgi:hypothetical protein